MLRSQLIPALWLACAASALARPVAMVTEVSGEVRMAGKQVQLFDSVEPGTRFDVGAGGHWTLSFVRAGRKSSGGAGHFLISETGVSGGPTHDTVAPGLAGVSLDNALNWDRMGGLRRDPSLMVWKIDPGVEDPHESLTWTADPTVIEAELVIEKLPTYERVLKKTTASNALSADLQPGESYVLRLRGFQSNGTAVEAQPYIVRVLTGEERRTLAALEHEPAELCYYASQLGLRHRAAQLAQALLESNPGDERLQALVREGEQ